MISLVPYSIAPSAPGDVFQIGLSGDGTSTSVTIYLLTAPFSAPIREFVDKIIGVVSALISGAIAVVSSTVNGKGLTLTFGSPLLAPPATYTLSVVWQVSP